MSIQLLRLGDAKALTQASGLPIFPEDDLPTRYDGVG
jgi:hypothetical protein